MIDFTQDNLNELAEDPNLESIHLGEVVCHATLYCVYDYGLGYKSITMEPADTVLVTKHKDGTAFMHFMSLGPRTFHYKAPFHTDIATMKDEAIYHV